MSQNIALKNVYNVLHATTEQTVHNEDDTHTPTNTTQKKKHMHVKNLDIPPNQDSKNNVDQPKNMHTETKQRIQKNRMSS